MAVCFLFSLVLAGAAQLILDLAGEGDVSWLGVLQVSVAAALVGYLAAVFRERGFLFALLAAVVVAALLGLIGKTPVPRLLRVLLVFGFEVIFVGLILTGDYLGGSRLALRALLGAAGGVLAGVAVFGIAGLTDPELRSFWSPVSNYLPVILELGVAPPLALLLTRLLLGERKTIKPEEELE